MNKKYILILLFVTAAAAIFVVQRETKKGASQKVEKISKSMEKSKEEFESMTITSLKNLNLEKYKKIGDRTLIGSDLSAPQEIPTDKKYINKISKDWKEKFLGFMNEGSEYDRKIKIEVLGSHIISHEKYLMNAESVKIGYIQPDGSSASFKAFINSSNGVIIRTYDLVNVKPELEKDQFEGKEVATVEEITKLTGMLENDEELAGIRQEELHQDEIEERNRALASKEISDGMAKNEEEILEDVQNINQALQAK
jgi:hypothetical protein